MVRTFEYSTGKEDALMQTQLVFEKLGYKITSEIKDLEKTQIYNDNIALGKSSIFDSD